MSTNLELAGHRSTSSRLRMAAMAVSPEKATAHQRLVDEEGAPLAGFRSISARHHAAERKACMSLRSGARIWWM